MLTLAETPARWLTCLTMQQTRGRSRDFPTSTRILGASAARCARERASWHPSRRQQDNARTRAFTMDQDLPGFAAGSEIST